MNDEKQLPPLAQRLRRLREARGLSQMELAVKAKLSLSAIFQVEQGRKEDVRASTLLAIAQALGVSMDELFRGGAVVSCLMTEADEPAGEVPAAEVEEKPAKRGRKKKGK